jgi:hypothetical protein
LLLKLPKNSANIIDAIGKNPATNIIDAIGKNPATNIIDAIGKNPATNIIWSNLSKIKKHIKQNI